MDIELGELPRMVDERVEFQTLYRDEFDRQVRRAALLISSSEIANDIVQDCFVRIYQRWDTINEPGPYLHRSVLNGCRDQARRRTRDRVLLTKLSDRPDDFETTDVLWDVLEALPFNQRAAVVLRYYAGMSEREIAEQLNCRPGSVGPWIRRGLDKMRKALQ